MNLQKDTLADAEEKLDDILSTATYLNSESYPDDLKPVLQEHLLDDIELLQGMLVQMRLLPEMRVQEAIEQLKVPACSPI